MLSSPKFFLYNWSHLRWSRRGEVLGNELVSVIISGSRAFEFHFMAMIGLFRVISRFLE